MNSRLKGVLIFAVMMLFFFASNAQAYQRIVVLYAAASPVLKELGVSDRVVGVTRTDHTFKGVRSVGSHLRPNMELLKALKPDLIVAGSKRAFPEEISKRLRTDVFYYDPRSLEDILFKIKALGKLLKRQKRAEELIKRLKGKLEEVKPLKSKPTVVYEIMERPLKVAGSKSIINSIIAHAGGENLVKVKKKHVLISPERVISLNPDVYIYQVGPMNKKPTTPSERPYYKSLRAKVIKVDEYEFARPGINAFQAVVDLNRIFMEVIK